MLACATHTIALLARLRRSNRGAVALMGALSLSVIVGMGAFAVEASQGYAQKVRNQRVSDMAALAGALAYNVNKSEIEMRATAKAVVAAQGVAASAATVNLITDPTTSKQLVSVTVTTPVPLALARVMTSALSYDVTSVGMATVSATTTTAPPCISALSGAGQYGIDLTGGPSLEAPNCAINSNSGMSVPWGARMKGKQFNSGKKIDDPGTGVTTDPTPNNINQNKSNSAVDWMKDDSALKALLCKVNKLTGVSDGDYPDGNTVCSTTLTAPTTYANTGAADVTLGYRPRSDGGVHAFQTADYSCKYIIPAGNYTVGKLTIPGGCELTVVDGANIRADSIDMSGSAMTVGNGNFIVGGVFGFNSGSLITIGNGNHSFGTLSITGGRTLQVGTGNFNVTNGISLDGGSYLKVNIAAGNSVTVGHNSGTAISVGGGSFVCFTANCDAPSAAAGNFSSNGTIVTSGGSTIIFPKALTHTIAGDLNLNGSSTFGSGTYVIKGNFTNNTGGTMTGADVSFGLGGTFNLSGGTSMELAAPSSASSYGVPGILIATKSMQATKIGGGSQNKYAGLLYAPKSSVLLDGGASMTSSSAGCLMMIVNTLSLNGGAAVASSCTGLGGTSGTSDSVALYK
ncbi:pilus assembly protein TadG-related protein [Sphingomonas crocodyli]|uniref:Uncharacterized protein n=1 Tax=Sphingomonas crocodyli TaxID=1979270 RepID=A0A437M9Y7_9SPHN|nr:pilus assembly protein TadG-related protein [Sphingomonas crocodyli]RVT94445.1 hypothetical protein EOD43_11590 [Sphingomonas crocodyli]